MEALVKLNGQVIWKDKSARLVQYLSRAIWDTIQASEGTNVALVDQLKTLEYLMSTFRKLLRFGKCVDVFYGSFKSIHHPDIAIRLTLTLSKISSSLFLFADHILWLARTGLFKRINVKRWSDMASKYWFLSVVMNLVRDLYEIIRVCQSDSERIKSVGSAICCVRSFGDLSHVSLKTYACLLAHKAVVLDTIKNGCDFFIPLTALGHTKLTPRTIGLLGVISTIAGMIAVAQPTAKLVPS